MSNMSYCRWHNTLSDLRDCAHSLPDGEDQDEEVKLSEDELRARRNTFELMADMLQSIGINLDTHELTNAINALDKETQS